MVDYIKVEVYCIDTKLWSTNSFLEFKGSHSTTTGLIDNKKIAEYLGLKFVIYDSGLMYFAGSLHKYYNHLKRVKAPNQRTREQISKGFNGNQFNYTQLCLVLSDLNKKFNIDINKSVIRNIEFGVNVIHQFNTEKMLNNLILHKGKFFYNPLANTYRELKHSQYWIKCYDKSLQYGLRDSIIRFELKYKKMEQLNNLGIVYLADLKNMGLLGKAKKELLRRWNEILLFDYTIYENELTPSCKSMLIQFENSNYWKGIKSNHLDRPKKKYQAMEVKYSKHLKRKVFQLIEEQWDLLNTKCVTIDHLIRNKQKKCVSNDHSTIVSTLTHQQTNHNLINNTLNNIIITHYGI